MDPNNNQPLETNPVVQPVAQPAPTNVPESPKEKSNKVIILLVILLLLTVGMIAYILFAGAQINNNQNTTADYNSSAIPSPTMVPTLAPEEDLEIASPEADLLELETDVKTL